MVQHTIHWTNNKLHTYKHMWDTCEGPNMLLQSGDGLLKCINVKKGTQQRCDFCESTAMFGFYHLGAAGVTAQLLFYSYLSYSNS